jgi:Mg2+ and Co2+ transporter CorA
MKIFTYIVLALATVLIGINVMNLDFKNLFEGDSLIALIGILAILCAVVILLIFRVSKAIDEKLKKHS